MLSNVALYAGLVAIANSGDVTVDQLDCYDAMLWILCFFVIELNIFMYEEEYNLAAVAWR